MVRKLELLEHETGDLILDERIKHPRDNTLTSTVSFNEEMVFGVESADVSMEEETGEYVLGEYAAGEYEQGEYTPQSAEYAPHGGGFGGHEPDNFAGHLPMNFRISDEV